VTVTKKTSPSLEDAVKNYPRDEKRVREILNSPIRSDNVTFSRADRQVSVFIRSSKDNRVVGQIVFPAHTFPKGCVLSIEQGQEPKKPKDSCSDPAEPLSPLLSIRPANDNCGDVSRLSGDVKIRLVGVQATRKGTICFAFAENDGDHWDCLSHYEVNPVPSRGIAVYSSKTDHLTTFAALLNLHGKGKPDCHFRWRSHASQPKGKQSRKTKKENEAGKRSRKTKKENEEGKRSRT